MRKSPGRQVRLNHRARLRWPLTACQSPFECVHLVNEAGERISAVARRRGAPAKVEKSKRERLTFAAGAGQPSKRSLEPRFYGWNAQKEVFRSLAQQPSREENVTLHKHTKVVHLA